MARRSRKKVGFTGLLIRIVIFFWAVSFFGGMGKRLSGFVLPGKYPHTAYTETKEILTSIEPYQNEIYPDAFIPAKQKWQYDRRNWSGLWHISKKELSAAAKDLDTFIEKGLLPVNKEMSQEEYNIAFFSALYKRASESNAKRLNNIVTGLNWFRQKNELNDRAFIELVISLIQDIPYEIPEDRRFGLATPQEVLSDNRGDCDSKSILAAVILSRFGIDSVIFLSPYYQHAMLGLQYTAVGDYKEYRGRPYYFVEMTRPGWRIGQLPDEVGNASKWFVVPLK